MTEEALEKEAIEEYLKIDRDLIACQDEGEVFNIGYIIGAKPREKRILELEKENAKLRAAYDKQKELNEELADDIGALQDELRTAKEHILAANKAYDALAAQIRQANEREAQDIRARFPC